MVFILGAKGFVGSAFVRFCRLHALDFVPIDRNNYEALKGRRCDLFINAAGNSSKRLAQLDPVKCLDRNARDTLLSALDFVADTYVYLSSCDVYNDCSSPRLSAECSPIIPTRLSEYGMMKYIGELLVRQYARRSIIIRLGGMVGPGLQKNAIYDLTHGGRLYVHPESAYQYLHTDEVAESVLRLARELPSGDVVNLCGDGVVVLRIVQGWLRQATLASDVTPERYEINIAKVKSQIVVSQSEMAVRKYIKEVCDERGGV